MSLEDTPEGIAGANAAASDVDVDVIGETGTPFCASTGTGTEQEPLHEENAEDDNKIGNGNGNSDGNYSDADANSNPPSDDIATSAAKLGDDNDEGVVDARITIAKAMRTETETMPVEQSVEATVGMALEAETAVEQQHQQQQSFLQESNANDQDAMLLQSSEEDQRDPQGEETADVFARSAGEDSGDNSHTMDDEDDDDATRMVCQPVVGTTTAATEFGADGEGEGGAMVSMETDTDTINNNTTTPTHRRTNSDTNRKKRLCRFPGCTRVIKSQGHCQRHGAKAKRCKVEGCEKQAQGTHNGMCKRHWRAVHFPDQVAAKAEAARKKELEEQPPPPYGESVYDNVLPASIAYRPSFASHQHQQAQLEKTAAASGSGSHGNTTTTDVAAAAVTPMTGTATAAAENHSATADPVVPKTPPPSIVSAMPLVTFLGDGALHKDVGWHRQAERRARGIFPCASLSAQLEPWEKQLALVEILLLSGGTPHANFRDLAHAWGRERGFHQVLAGSVCTRRGEVERKKRSDAGMGKKSLTTAAATKNDHQGGGAGGSGGPVTPTGAGATLHNSQQQQQQPHRKRPKSTTIIHHQPPPEATAQIAQAAAAAQPNYQTPMVPWHQQAQQHQQIMDNTMPASNTINGDGNNGVVMTNDVGVVDTGVGGNNGGYHQEQQPTENNNTTPSIYKPEMT